MSGARRGPPPPPPPDTPLSPSTAATPPTAPATPHNFKKHTPYPNPSSRPSAPVMPRSANFADMPFDILAKIAAPFDIPDLWSASKVCRSWREALGPLREAMVLLRWGKRFKHGYGGGAVKPDRGKALESFLKGVERGSAAAMVDAGLMYWEMGRKEEAMALYRRSAEIGYPAGQCNLAICYLEADPQEPLKAVQLFYQAAKSGYARAQYNLARCLRKGHGVNCNISEAGFHTIDIELSICILISKARYRHFGFRLNAPVLIRRRDGS